MPVSSKRRQQPVSSSQLAWLEGLRTFVVERHNIYLRKSAGKPKPYTTDPILRDWRFCNIYRELDTVTKWVAENWRTPHATDPDLFFALAVARFVNWPDSLAELGYPNPWRPDWFVEVLEGRQRRGEKVFTAAYVVHADQNFAGSKAAYLATKVFGPMWRDRHSLRPKMRGTLAEAHAALTAYHGVGGFMSAQILADLKYVQPLLNAPDWWTWAASGPGSRRGLNRILGRPVNTPWEERAWLRSTQRLREELAPLLAAAKMPPVHCQDVNNICCEYDKYLRVKLGEGKPRSSYPGMPRGRSGRGDA